MKIGFFPRYDRLGASSRHRFFNYFERWQKGMDESCQLAIYPGLSDCYLQKLYHNGKVGKLTQAWELAKLFKRACLIRCDAMVIEYELMIGLPYKYDNDISEALTFISHDKKRSASGLSIIRVDVPGEYIMEKMPVEDFRSLVIKPQ